MRRVTGAVVCVALALTNAAGASADGDQRAIDPAKSSAQFSIPHVFVSRVTGRVPIRSGQVTFVPGSALPSAVSAVLDATKLDTGERDRDASLQSPDYFDTTQFPTWTFVSTKIVPVGPAAFGIDGQLTMHGVTQPEHLDVTVAGDAARPVYHAVGHIDRHAFGMRGARLDPVIGKTADITLEVVLE